LTIKIIQAARVFVFAQAERVFVFAYWDGWGAMLRSSLVGECLSLSVYT